MKMADRQCSSSLWDTHLQPRDGQACTPLSHQREREKRALHLVQSHRRLVCLWMCKCVSMFVCEHLCACVYELFVSLPQALGCWVCSLKRLCFCCHLSHSPSLCFSLRLCLPLLCLSVCIIPSVLSVCIPLWTLYRNCFQRTQLNVGGVSRSKPLTSSTANDLMLFEREAG